MLGAASQVVTLDDVVAARHAGSCLRSRHFDVSQVFPPTSKRIPGLPGAARAASVCQKPLHTLSIRQFASASALFKSYHMRTSIDDTYDMGGRVGVGVASL